MKVIKSILICMGVICLALGVTACSGFGSMKYENAENYSVGDTSFTETIENIDVDWVSGKVKIATHADESVLLTEKTDFAATEDMRVHWWLDGETLRVKFCASGMGISIFGYGQKELTITIPETAVLAEIKVSTSSADFSTEEINANKISVSTSSGSMNVSCQSDKINLNSMSGNIKIKQSKKANSVDIDTSSGKIEANINQCEDVYLDSVSGKIEANVTECNRAEINTTSGGIKVIGNKIEKATIKSTSGTIECRLKEDFKKCTLNAISGEINLFLPGGIGFVANVNSTSGSFNSDFALKRNGNTYTCNDGSAQIDLTTTSGNISVKEL